MNSYIKRVPFYLGLVVAFLTIGSCTPSKATPTNINAPQSKQHPLAPSSGSQNGEGVDRGEKGEGGKRGPEGSSGSMGNTGIQGERGEKGDTVENVVSKVLQAQLASKAFAVRKGKEENVVLTGHPVPSAAKDLPASAAR